MKLTKDDRVVVSIQDPETYAHGCADALNGKVGTVAEVKKTHEGERFLVEFDMPAPKWWSNQTPATAFHFPECDLKPLPDFWAVAIDETDNYRIDEDDAPRIKRILGVYFYDKRTHTHCAELTPSYWLVYLYAVVEVAEGVSDAERDRLVDEYGSEPSDDIYASVPGIDSVEPGPLHVRYEPGKDEAPTEDSVREYWQSNCPI